MIRVKRQLVKLPCPDKRLPNRGQLSKTKKGDLKPGLGQCVAEMIAAQKFNQENNIPITNIYGSVTNGTTWRFLKLEAKILSIDLKDYPVPPVEILLGMLVWMVCEG